MLFRFANRRNTLSTTELKAARSPRSYKTSPITIGGCGSGGGNAIDFPFRAHDPRAPGRARLRGSAAERGSGQPNLRRPRTAKRCPQRPHLHPAKIPASHSAGRLGFYLWRGFPLPSLPPPFSAFSVCLRFNRKSHTSLKFRTALQLTSQIRRLSANTGYIDFRNVCNYGLPDAAVSWELGFMLRCIINF